MATCIATKRNGEPCTLPAVGKQGLCWAHDPKNAEQRRRRASKGGRGKANTEIRDLKSLIADLTDRVLSGELEKGKAAIANQLINTQLRAVELERRIKETDELAERIEALESRQTLNRGPVRRGNTWGL